MDRVRTIPAIHSDRHVAVTTYHCPRCDKSSHYAMVKNNAHKMTVMERRSDFVHIGHELLTCICGHSYTWFQATQKQGKGKC